MKATGLCNLVLCTNMLLTHCGENLSNWFNTSVRFLRYTFGSIYIHFPPKYWEECCFINQEKSLNCSEFIRQSMFYLGCT